MPAFLFQNGAFKGLFRECHHNVQKIPRYVRSDLGIYKSLANVISIRHQLAKSKYNTPTLVPYDRLIARAISHGRPNITRTT